MQAFPLPRSSGGGPFVLCLFHTPKNFETLDGRTCAVEHIPAMMAFAKTAGSATVPLMFITSITYLDANLGNILCAV